MSSKLIVNTIRHTGASSDAVTLASDGTCTANLTNKPNRNLIINGDFSVDQRNSGSEVNPAVNGTFSLDRWKNTCNSAGKYKIQQVSDSPDGFYKSLKVTSLSALSVGSGEFQHIDHNIEGLNMNHLNFGSSAAKTITLSFFVKASITGTFPVAFRNNAYNRTNVNTYTISSANTWEKKTITITGDTSGTWLQTNGKGMRIAFALAGGSDYDVSSLSTWIGSNDFTHSSCTDLLATNGATLQLAGVQLEVGSVATDFEHRSFGQELALCMRYYETHNSLATAKSTDGSITSYWSTVTSNDSNTLVIPTGIIYKVPKRASPTVTIYNPGNTATAARVSAQGTERIVTATYGGPNALTRIYVSGASAGNYVTYNWEASAEL